MTRIDGCISMITVHRMHLNDSEVFGGNLSCVPSSENGAILYLADESEMEFERLVRGHIICSRKLHVLETKVQPKAAFCAPLPIGAVGTNVSGQRGSPLP
jgi:hypothetical protein